MNIQGLPKGVRRKESKIRSIEGEQETTILLLWRLCDLSGNVNIALIGNKPSRSHRSRHGFGQTQRRQRFISRIEHREAGGASAPDVAETDENGIDVRQVPASVATTIPQNLLAVHLYTFSIGTPSCPLSGYTWMVVDLRRLKVRTIKGPAIFLAQFLGDA